MGEKKDKDCIEKERERDTEKAFGEQQKKTPEQVKEAEEHKKNE